MTCSFETLTDYLWMKKVKDMKLVKLSPTAGRNQMTSGLALVPKPGFGTPALHSS